MNLSDHSLDSCKNTSAIHILLNTRPFVPDVEIAKGLKEGGACLGRKFRNIRLTRTTFQEQNLLDMSSILQAMAPSCELCKRREQDVLEKKFMVNTISTCGHKFCMSCLNDKFYRATYFICPTCSAKVSQNTLSSQAIEEVEFERDAKVRRAVKAIFNRTEADFSSVDEFRDFEEMVEDIIYNKVHNINVEETDRRIKAYEQENIRAIAVNQSRRLERTSQEQQEIADESSRRTERDAAYESQLKQELHLKSELKKLQDSIAIGDEESLRRLELLRQRREREFQLTKATPAASDVAEVNLNPVLQFLNQRPDPIVLDPAASLARTPVHSEAEKHDRWMRTMRAGGYDPSISAAKARQSWDREF